MNITDDTQGRFSGAGLAAEVFATATRKEWFLHHSMFAALPQGSIEALLTHAEIVRFGRKQRLFPQGETVRHFLILGSGCVRLEREINTRRVPLPIRGPGDCLGETVFDVQYHHADVSAFAMSDVEALAFPMNELHVLAAQDAHVRAAILSRFDHERLRAQNWLEALLHLDVEGRIAQVLVEALSRFGESHGQGRLIAAPLTHADLAGLIGSTRETVTLTLGKMKRSGIIDFFKRRIVVRDEAALKRCLRSL